MRLHHGRTAIELYELQSATGPGLLLLHELFGCADDWRQLLPLWNGPVYALDFCGHGRAESVRGGAYFAELLVGDADRALDHTGAVAVAGKGIGAYLALILAGARAERVRGAALLEGRGLTGGGAMPNFDLAALVLEEETERAAGRADPLVYVLDRDVRPTDYAAHFAAHASQLFLVEDGTERPPWWQAVRALGQNVMVEDSAERAFAALARSLAANEQG
jgi:pimeloyl-ACP methyl ester carboxylesterase